MRSLLIRPLPSAKGWIVSNWAWTSAAAVTGSWLVPFAYVDQVAHQDFDAVVRCGDMRRAVRRGPADPPEAVPPRSLVTVVQVRG